MIFNTTNDPKIEELVEFWNHHFEMHEWQDLVKGLTPKATGCGPVYELGAPDNQLNQSAAIADMRKVNYATPHYHSNGETEVYFVLEGAGRVVVGGEVLPLEKGTVIVTPPNTAHYALPANDLVLGVVNTPPFKPDNNVDLSESNPEVGYDHEQFKDLVTHL